MLRKSEDFKQAVSPQVIQRPLGGNLRLLFTIYSSPRPSFLLPFTAYLRGLGLKGDLSAQIEANWIKPNRQSDLVKHENKNFR